MDDNVKNSGQHLKKTTSRLVALQILYSEDFFDDGQQSLLIDDYIEKYKMGEIYSDFIQSEDTIIEPDEVFLRELLQMTKQNLSVIDENIIKFLKSGWTLEKIDPIVKTILRLAVCEMLFFGDIPIKVILDQYVSLARDFYISDEIGFVNAILDAIAKKVRDHTNEKNNISKS